MPIQVREDTDSFQSLINKALVGKPCHSVDEKGVFFAPFGEDHEPGNHLGRVMKHLNDYVSPDGPRVHVGVAGGFNFSIAAKTRPDCILLLDMNQRQAQFWGKVIELLKANPSRDEFANACRVFIENSPDFSPNLYDINSYTHRQYPDFADWIEDSDAYAYLHQLACDGHIAVATLDLINDTEACAAIGSALKQHGLTVDTCYWSNVGSYIQPYPTHRRQDIPQRPAFSNGMFNTKESDAKDPKQRPVKKGLKEGLIYPTTSFFEASGDASGQKHDVLWDGHNVPIEVVPGVKYHTRYKSVPMFEQMLCNISAIGGDPHTRHILTSISPEDALIITDGPPRGSDAAMGRKTWRERYIAEHGVLPPDETPMR